jgi:hypothetical protein
MTDMNIIARLALTALCGAAFVFLVINVRFAPISCEAMTAKVGAANALILGNCP